MFRNSAKWALVCVLLAAPCWVLAQHEQEGQQDNHAGHDHSQQDPNAGHNHGQEGHQDHPHPIGVDSVSVMDQKVRDMLAKQDFQTLGDYLERHLDAYGQYAMVWFQYGYARHMTKNYEKSLESWLKAESLSFENKPILYFNIACAASRLGKLDVGFDYLNKAIEVGVSAEVLESDADLSNMRKDERFAGVVARAKGEQ